MKYKRIMKFVSDEVSESPNGDKIIFIFVSVIFTVIWI